MRLIEPIRRLLAASLWLSLPALALAAPPRPNIVVFVADDLGAMDIACNNPRTFHETPNLDRLAAGGVRFTSGYAANPVCSPTRFSLMTGRYPTRAGLTNWLPGVRQERFQGAELPEGMRLEEKTVAEYLGPAGYRTAYVGKWHLGEKATHWPEAQGFDINIGGYSAGAPASYFPPYRNPRLSDGPEEEHLSLRLAEESAKLIQRFHGEGKPFLLVHADYAPHNPVQAAPALVEKYRAKAERLGLKDEFGEEREYHLNVEGARRVRTAQSHAAYAALVETMDAAVGRILDELERLGIADNTVFIFVSDNGGLSTDERSRRQGRATSMPTSNAPLRAGKGWLYEGGIRVPFIVCWPGVAKKGATVDTPVMTIDIAPTLLAAAGLEETKMDGIDLAPIVRGRDGKPERALFWHYPHYSNQGGFPGGAILVDGWKLLENYEDGSVQLYRPSEDVSETKDLAPTELKRVECLRAQLHAWYASVNAAFLRARPDGPEPWTPPPLKENAATGRR